MRRERARAVGNVFDGVRDTFMLLVGVVVALVLLWGMPFLYASSSFLVLVLPLRWMTGHEPLTLLGFAEFLGAFAIACIGIFRAWQGSEPIAPVRRAFARTMLGLCWIGAALLVAADIWG